MKIVFALFLLCYLGGEGTCQQIGFFTGYCTNEFYDIAEENPHFKSSYKKGNGGSAGIKIERFRIVDKLRSDTFHLSVALRFTTYDGEMEIYGSGLGSGATVGLQSTKYLLGIELMPINKKIYKELMISIGVELSFLIAHKQHGYQKRWAMNTISIYEKIDDNNKANQSGNFGIIFNVQYNLKIGNRIYLTPSYNFYLGLTNEFENLGATIRSNRHNFNLGIAKRWGCRN